MEEANGRKKYLPEKRAEIMKQHLLEKKALSEVCDANGIHSTMYYRWLKELLSNAVYAFGKGKDRECQEWKNKALENLPVKPARCPTNGGGIRRALQHESIA